MPDAPRLRAGGTPPLSPLFSLRHQIRRVLHPVSASQVDISRLVSSFCGGYLREVSVCGLSLPELSLSRWIFPSTEKAQAVHSRPTVHVGLLLLISSPNLGASTTGDSLVARYLWMGARAARRLRFSFARCSNAGHRDLPQSIQAHQSGEPGLFLAPKWTDLNLKRSMST